MTTKQNPVKYRTQVQAKKTAINTINGFITDLTKIYQSVPPGSVDEIIWLTSLLVLITDCKETVKDLRAKL